MNPIYLSIMSGLGNQLYILAYADFLQRKLGKLPRLLNFDRNTCALTPTQDRSRRDLSQDLFTYLSVPLVTTGSWEFRLIRTLRNYIRLYREPDGEAGLYLEQALPPRARRPRLVLPGLCRVSGYFQSYRYLSSAFVDRIRQFLEGVPLSSKLQTLAEGIDRSDVAIHLRRGDFLKHPEIYRIFGSKHYLTGLDQLASEAPIGQVYVFSDDFEGIRETLTEIGQRYPLVLVQGGNIYEDLFLLTRFRRYVLAGSTFSWWGVFCSQYGEEAQVVVPRQPLRRAHEADSYFPPRWMKIEAEE